MIIAGCNKERTGASRPQQQRQTLRLGLVPEQSIFKQVHRYGPLADYLSSQLNVNVSLSVMPGHDKALSSFAAKELDAAFFREHGLYSRSCQARGGAHSATG